MVLGWLFDKLRGHCSGPRRDPKLAASQRSGVTSGGAAAFVLASADLPRTREPQTFTPFRKLWPLKMANESHVTMR